MGRGYIGYKKRGAFYVLMTVNGARYFYCKKIYRHPEEAFSVILQPEELSLTQDDGTGSVRENYALMETDPDDLKNSLSYANDIYNSYRAVIMSGFNGGPGPVAFVRSGTKQLSMAYSMDETCLQCCTTIEDTLRHASSSGALYNAVFRDNNSDIFIKKLKRAKAGKRRIKFLKGGVSCTGIRAGKLTLYFLPDMIMIVKKDTLYFADYSDVVFSYAVFSDSGTASFSKTPSGSDEYALMHVYAVSYDEGDMTQRLRLQAVISVADTSAAATLEKAFRDTAKCLDKGI